MAVSNLTLVLPPLCSADTDTAALSKLLTKKHKSLKRLIKIFSRGEKASFDSQAITLANLFGLAYSDPDTFPMAAIMAFGAGLDASTGYWLCAEPIYLHPDLDHVLLFDKSTFDLTKQELAQLVSEIDEMLLEEGISTHHGHQQSLFFQTVDKSEVVFTPISKVSGKNILQYLPEGDDAAKWRLLLNEIQMMMTQSIVNREREQQGLVSVNGLWFWGGGYLLRAKYKQVFDTVYANNLFTQGLAKITSTKAQKGCENFDALDSVKNSLVVFEPIDTDPATWVEFLIQLDKQWLQPALAQIKKQQCDTLTLITGKTKLTFTKKNLSQFWKRSTKAATIVDAL